MATRTAGETIAFFWLGIGTLMILFCCCGYCKCCKGREQDDHDMNREMDVRRRQESEDSMNREIALRGQLGRLVMQKEHLISEANRTEDLEQNVLLRNQIEELEQEILGVQSQLAEEIARQNGVEEEGQIELRSRHSEILRSSRSQRISEGINALSQRLHGANSTRDVYFHISQEEQTREYILLNIIHKKVIAKGNISSSSDDIDEEAPQSKDDIILPNTTGGDVEDNLTSSTSIRNMCIICCDNYEEGDDIAYSRNQECHHFYHVECILEWLMRDNNDDCPLCRSAFLVD
ncbi:hypothetical protein CTEN210_03974 [Chaetoceros tenuissimus]|uniref:RING-type domain-containing protein n=1 Tax=Chaetoceros tenuissimus TaxID=426638 RepID=A0AAD3CKT3_9STRA|nr:hypothetical protein CTEN210_03974 [Chaetoceros tenuissimus]